MTLLAKLTDHRTCHNVARLLAPVMVVGALGLAPASAVQAAGENFYAGKTFTVMVATKPGGGTDTVGRLVARFWGNHIPGNPEVVVRNKPMQVIGANDLHNKVRPNGLTVGVFAGGGSLGPVARKSGSVRYDPLEWEYVGSVERGPSIQLMRKSALDRLRDSSKPPIAMGSVSTDRTQDAVAVFGAEYLGWNLKFVLGYPNSNALYLAYGRGEIDMFGSGTGKIIERFVNEEGAVPVAAQARRKDMPEVPTFVELLGDKKPSGDKWAAFQVWTGPSGVDKYFALPPKTPQERVVVLRKSFQATTHDPEFEKQATNILGGGYSILDHEETRSLVEGAINVTPGALAEIKRLRAKYGLPPVKRQAKPLVAVTFDEVRREGRWLHFEHDGKPMKLKVSGSRSEVTIAGKIAPRSKLKPGMTCLLNWAKRGDRLEARKVDCLAKVTFDDVKREGRWLHFSHNGKPMKLKVSGSRSEVTIAGKIAPRSNLKAGMTCSLNWAKRGDRLEARKVICP